MTRGESIAQFLFGAFEVLLTLDKGQFKYTRNVNEFQRRLAISFGQISD